MIIKEHIVRRGEGGGAIVELPAYRCDNCNAEFAPPENEGKHVKAFYKEKVPGYGGDMIPRADKYQFCSWYCVLAKLPDLETRFDSFLALPCPYPGEDILELIDAIRVIGASWEAEI